MEDFYRSIRRKRPGEVSVSWSVGGEGRHPSWWEGTRGASLLKVSTPKESRVQVTLSQEVSEVTCAGFIGYVVDCVITITFSPFVSVNFA